MQIGQGIGVDGLFLLHNRGYHRADNGLTDHLCSLCLEQPSDRDIAMHAL
jgi:hypothetical protein